LHVLSPAAATVTGPNRDGSARCPADWLQGANVAWQDVDLALDQPLERVPLNTSALHPLPALRLEHSPEPTVTSVTALATLATMQMEAPTPAHASSLIRQTAIEFGNEVHALLAEYGPGMTREQADQHLHGFAKHLPPERYEKLLTQLSNPELIPGYWSAQRCLVEQPVIGEHQGQLMQGVCDVLLQDKTGAWHLYDWKTGEAINDPASSEQVRRYAQLVTPYLDGPLISMALVDVERGEIRTVN
jgi:ATP-dependent exoDNAse (exonuclease V) beta subunit